MYAKIITVRYNSRNNLKTQNRDVVKMGNKGFIGLTRELCILTLALMAASSQVYAFNCSIFEGETSEIPSFKTEIAELKNMNKRGRHIKVLVPRQGPVQEFNLSEYIENIESNSEVKQKLALVEGGTVIYIDLFPIEKRYEIRMGLLTTDLMQVIKPTVYANFEYNTQHNELYDLQSKIAVFCNWNKVPKIS